MIYNKKEFGFGLFILTLGLVNFVFAIIRKDFDANKIIVILCSAVLGISSISRSISKRMSQKDKEDELDERNKLIDLKSKQKGLEILQIVLLCSVLIFVVWGKLSSNTELIYIGLISGIICAVSYFIEFITFVYYQFKY